jgi:hypothetical protein
MPQIQVAYDRTKGPILIVEIGYPVRLSSPGSSPLSMMVPLLIDTGARRTHISQQVSDQLSLMPYSRTKIHFGSQSIEVEQYLGDFRIPGTSVAHSGMLFPDFPNPTRDYQGVLGRNILDHGILHIDGINGEIILTF